MNKRFFLITVVNDDKDNQLSEGQIADSIDPYDEHEGSISVREMFGDRIELYDGELE